MSKLSTQMASCCRGVQREEASHKLNLKCASPRVAEACCYTELGHVRPAGLGDDHHCPVPFLVLHRVRVGRPAIHCDYHHSPVPFLVLHRVWAGEGNLEKQSPVPFLVLHRDRGGEGILSHPSRWISEPPSTPLSLSWCYTELGQGRGTWRSNPLSLSWCYTESGQGRGF